METSERRMAIMRLLCRRRHETIKNLALEFGVSERTIRRDIEVLSGSEPIYTQAGRYGGGVYVIENYTNDRLYLTNDEIQVLQKLYVFAEHKTVCVLLPGELELLKRMILEFSKDSDKDTYKHRRRL